MFVRDRMSPDPVTVTADTSFQEALKTMRERGFRRLPVVDHRDRLIGIVSERDLLYASPSPASSLNVWEMNYLLSKLEVEEIMTKDVITTSAETPIEDAARLIVDHKIGGLPVVDKGNRVVGVITETDIFKSFVEMFGGGRSGLRITLEVPERRGVLAELAQTITDLGGDIASVGTFEGDEPGERELVIKVRDVSRDDLIDSLEALGDHVLDARDV